MSYETNAIHERQRRIIVNKKSRLFISRSKVVWFLERLKENTILNQQ
jgi:hypothetical protein